MSSAWPVLGVLALGLMLGWIACWFEYVAPKERAERAARRRQDELVPPSFLRRRSR